MKQKTAAEKRTLEDWQKIRLLQKTNKELQKFLDLGEANEIQTFEGKEYIIPIREVVLHLVKLNVVHRHVAKAIRIIMEKLTPYKVNCLPSQRTINKIVHEAKCLALMQAGKDMLPDEEALANILMEDATTKRKKNTMISLSAPPQD